MLHLNSCVYAQLRVMIRSDALASFHAVKWNLSNGAYAYLRLARALTDLDCKAGFEPSMLLPLYIYI